MFDSDFAVWLERADAEQEVNRRPSEHSDGLTFTTCRLAFKIIPTRYTNPKNNLTSLSRLAVLSVLSQASALLAYFFKLVLFRLKSESIFLYITK